MGSKAIQWITKNLGTLLLALVLAIVVWVSATISADPNETNDSKPVDIEVIGLKPDLLVMNEIPDNTRLTLKAPNSVWSRLNRNPKLMEAWIDLTGLDSGTHIVEVSFRVNASPVEPVSADPQAVEIQLEKSTNQDFPIEFIVLGEPPLGYRKLEPESDYDIVNVSGPESAVERIDTAKATINIDGETETVVTSAQVVLLDDEGKRINNISLSPRTVEITQPVERLGGFKNVVIKPDTFGQVANGYRLTNISVAPTNVTLFSEDPRLVEDLPGFIETNPVDLSGLTDDQESIVNLDLPDGVTTVGNQDVIVQISVAAIEGSTTFTLPVTIIGLEAGFTASISPPLIEVITAGPLNILETLDGEDFIVVVDVSDLPDGIYQKQPEIEVLNPDVRIQTTLPETVEVTIEIAPTATAAPQLTETPTPVP
jgi:YbbR domain-containing protein